MARKYRNEILTGGFILAAATLFFVLLLMMGSFNALFEAYETVDVVFDDTQGLREGDPVFLLGSKVGAVRKLELRKKVWGIIGPREQGEMARVVVTLGLPHDFWKLVREDSAVLIDRNITGNLSVLIFEGKGRTLEEIRNQDPAAGILLKGDVVLRVDLLAAQIERTLEQINKIVDEMADMLRDIHGSGHIESILKNTSESTEALRQHLQPLLEQAGRVASRLEGILDDNREGLKKGIDGLARSGELLARFLDERLEPAAKSLEGALASVEKASTSIDGLLVRNRGSIDSILGDLKQAADNAKTLTTEVRRRPWRLLYKPSDDELVVLDLYDAASNYNNSAAVLNSAVQELGALATAGKSADPELLKKAFARVEDSIKRQREVETVFYDLLKRRLGE